MDLPDLDASRHLARSLAAVLTPGSVVRLDGPMGAGKTTLTRLIVEALGGDPAAVASPTYTLLHRYEARIPVVHVDACRLAGPEALEGLGFSEQAEDAIAIVEWGVQVAAALPADSWLIVLDHAEGRRTATIMPPPGKSLVPVRQPVAARSALEAPAAREASAAPVAPGALAPVPAAAAPELPGSPSPTAGDAQPAAADPAPIRVISIAADAAGGDPLVATWLGDHRATAAHRMVSYPWLGLGALVSLALGSAGYAWAGAPGFIGGAALGGLVLSLIGSRRPDPVGQEPLLAATAVLVLWLIAFDLLIGLGILAGLLTLVYMTAVVFRALALALGGRGGLRTDQPQEPAGGWPMYTILVPLYREENIAGSIMANLSRLDYPRERLDVKFLVEADDPLTRNALEKAGVPAFAEVVVVPHAQPKTKPRACNHGLARARGELLVIFDAEDRPDPDQLKQAVAAFAAQPQEVACLQAQLAWHNHRTNLITRWFALEYNVWFRRYLPGLLRLRAPIPLGGTSNHFRIAPLRQLGGWDPFNVTEDCDLGVRLHLAGYRTACLDSTTWEEAPEHLGAWIKQRTRWLKGYLVTHLVWGRRPFSLLGRLGPAGSVGFLLAVGAVPVLAAVNLALWTLLLVWLACLGWDLAHSWSLMALLTERDYGAERASWPVWYSGPGEHPVFAGLSQGSAIAACILMLGNVFFMLATALAGRRPGQRASWGPALLVPVYWLMLGVAAMRAVGQLITKPHLWEKTTHGLAKPSAPGT